MSPTNREITERAFQALQRRDLNGYLDLIDPDVEFTSLIAEAEGQTFRGHDGVRDWWARVADALGGLDFRLEDFEDLGGDRAIATITVAGRIARSEVSQRMYQVLRAREGKAVSWHFYRTREEAQTAVGAEK
jgi:ketosteroid isomerase-like protein